VAEVTGDSGLHEGESILLYMVGQIDEEAFADQVPIFRGVEGREDKT